MSSKVDDYAHYEDSPPEDLELGTTITTVTEDQPLLAMLSRSLVAQDDPTPDERRLSNSLKVLSEQFPNQPNSSPGHNPFMRTLTRAQPAREVANVPELSDTLALNAKGQFVTHERMENQSSRRLSAKEGKCCRRCEAAPIY